MSHPSIECYATEVLDGLNSFIETDGYEMVLNETAFERDATRVTFSLTPIEKPPPEATCDDLDHEYTVETAGEEVTFAVEDGQHVHVISDAGNWGKFDVNDHVGEAASAAIESGLA